MGFGGIGKALGGMMGGNKAQGGGGSGGDSQEEYQRAVWAKKMHDKVYENSIGQLTQVHRQDEATAWYYEHCLKNLKGGESQATFIEYA